VHRMLVDWLTEQQIPVRLRSHGRPGQAGQALHFAPPDFLLNLVGSASFMRLSLRKAAHAALSTAAQQEIRVRYGREDKGYLGSEPCGLPPN